jgi:pimeloyl-ACP methyl ester carboxylesterase
MIEADRELQAGFDVRPFEYASPLATWGWRRIPDVDLLAGRLGTFLDVTLANYNRIVLVAHSQGGLVGQSYLHRMLSDGRGFNLARVRLIVLFACPNDGSRFLSPLR